VDSLLQIQSKLKAPKNQRNTFGNYNYRSCEDILEAVKPLLAEVGAVLTISDEMLNIGDRYYIKATVTFSSKEGSRQVTAFAREDESRKGMDGSQITGAASSYARKYALNGMFLIDDTKDADATNDGKPEQKPQQKPPQQAQKPPQAPQSSDPITCAGCAEITPQNVADFSKRKHGKILCLKCQKEVK